MSKTYGVRLKINVSNIIKEWLFSGKKGKYLDATVFINVDEPDQYGNHGCIKQDLHKEAPQGTQQPILGNAQIFWSNVDGSQPAYQQGGYTQAPGQPPGRPQSTGGFDDFSDENIPF